mmetsp:Transcript_987/g.1242  ORF Transcript_987/g.1242 Transcript_987/m.1242 type:complete len:300 (-) Transcript_987:174-1073(-)|eukprot:CAMPEP_0117755318 /NCGR_PEP_ID=MMETSP0947-20121206/13380_1 /TAXON_ID=44440 /ORGANISM="Chattonella subsalsa, Strain CCMP2191" /LENGTH=299 /DNA_ID=CAMNT_0005574629 /DNA_START=120 /DNA_END=1019 /DNA_ORIENTATION=-
MIRYFIPSDGDDPDHPNVFSLHNPSSSLRLHDIKQSFPLPGKFHFRFKKKFGSTHVWVDVVNEQQVVPQYEGQVVAKVERLGGGEPSNAQTCPQLQSNKHRIGRLLSLGESKEVASSIEHIKQKSAEQEADLLGTYSQQPRQSSAMSEGQDDLVGLFESSPAPSSQTSNVGSPGDNFFSSDPFAQQQQPMQPMAMSTQMTPPPMGGMPRTSSHPHTPQQQQPQQQTHPNPALNHSHHSQHRSNPMLAPQQMMQGAPPIIGMQNQSMQNSSQQMQQPQFAQQQNLLYNSSPEQKSKLFQM